MGCFIPLKVALWAHQTVLVIGSCPPLGLTLPCLPSAVPAPLCSIEPLFLLLDATVLLGHPSG